MPEPMRTRLLVIGAADLGLLGLAYLLAATNTTNNAVIAWAITAVGVVTLLGLLSSADNTTKVTTRFALGVAVATVWFGAVGAMLFYTGDEGPLARDAFNAISLTMSVVIAFYFGAQAYQAVGVARASATSGTETVTTDQRIVVD